MIVFGPACLGPVPEAEREVFGMRRFRCVVRLLLAGAVVAVMACSLSACPKKVEPATTPNPSMPGPDAYSPDAMKAKAGSQSKSPQVTQPGSGTKTTKSQ